MSSAKALESSLLSVDGAARAGATGYEAMGGAFCAHLQFATLGDVSVRLGKNISPRTQEHGS